MENVIIIGTGCAGYTAAIYSGRANLNPLVLAGTMPGGLLTTTTEVENFPGFPEGIQGFELMMNLQKQAERFGARVMYEVVEKVEKQADGTFLVDCGGKKYESRTVIVATGSGPKWLGLPNEEAMKNHGLTTCATCDGGFYRGEAVAVVGGGDSACEEASYLSRLCPTVYLIHRRDTLRASKIMADRALANPAIKPVWNSGVTEIIPDEKGDTTAITVTNLQTGEKTKLDVKCVFVAIGHVPNTGFLGGFAETDENGYLIQKKGTQTSVTGLFTAGDVADHVYRQAITAAGDGCRAAIDAERYIAEHFGA